MEVVPDGKGYLFPEDNISPDGFRCFKVYIPDDDVYQYAFFGAYEFFGKWLAWKRDAGKNGAIAAAAWREAIERTRCSMNCEPVDYTNPFLQIADAIRDIRVTQNVNVGCGCGCGDVATAPPTWWGDPPNTGTGDGEDPLDPPSDDWADSAAYALYKCSAANKIADDWLATVQGLSSLWGLVTTLGAAAAVALVTTSYLSGAIVGLMALGLSASGAVAAILGILAFLVISGGSALALFADLALGYDKESLVCGLYNSTSVTDARAAFDAVLANALDDLQAESGYSVFAAKVAEIVSIIVVDSVFATLFNYSADVDGYVGEYDCQCAVNYDYYAELGTSMTMWDGNWGAGLRAGVWTWYSWVAPKSGATGDADILSSTGIFGGSAKQVDVWLSRSSEAVGNKSVDIVLTDSLGAQIHRETIVAAGSGGSLPITENLVDTFKVTVMVPQGAVLHRVRFDGIHNGDTTNGNLNMHAIGIVFW